LLDFANFDPGHKLFNTGHIIHYKRKKEDRGQKERKKKNEKRKKKLLPLTIQPLIIHFTVGCPVYLQLVSRPSSYLL